MTAFKRLSHFKTYFVQLIFQIMQAVLEELESVSSTLLNEIWENK